MNGLDRIYGHIPRMKWISCGLPQNTEQTSPISGRLTLLKSGALNMKGGRELRLIKAVFPKCLWMAMSSIMSIRMASIR